MAENRFCLTEWESLHGYHILHSHALWAGQTHNDQSRHAHLNRARTRHLDDSGPFYLRPTLFSHPSFCLLTEFISSTAN
jgi:hypothetical protein